MNKYCLKEDEKMDFCSLWQTQYGEWSEQLTAATCFLNIQFKTDLDSFPPGPGCCLHCSLLPLGPDLPAISPVLLWVGHSFLLFRHTHWQRNMDFPEVTTRNCTWPFRHVTLLSFFVSQREAPGLGLGLGVGEEEEGWGYYYVLLCPVLILNHPQQSLKTGYTSCLMLPPGTPRPQLSFLHKASSRLSPD